MGGLEPGQVRQKMASKPEKRLRLADLAERDLKVFRPPLGLELATGQGEPNPHPIGRLNPTENPGPEVVEHRVGDQRAERRASPIGERSEHRFILNRLVLEGYLARPDIERYRDRPKHLAVPLWHSDRWAFGNIVVNDQVQANRSGAS